jgi:hypothetical protein
MLVSGILRRFEVPKEERSLFQYGRLEHWSLMTSTLRPKQEVIMKRLLLGTVSAMLIALPLYANVGTASPDSGTSLESGDTQMMEQTPSEVPATETTPTGDQQKMEEDSAFETEESSTEDIEMQEDSAIESGSATDDVEMQEGSETESDM